MLITWLGHSCFMIEEGPTRLLIDPFLTGNPSASCAADDVSPTVIALTHGHADHLGDTVAIAQRSKAPVVAIVELANEIAGEGVETVDLNLGGTKVFDWGWIKLVPAWHTAVSPSGTPHTPAGLVLKMGDTVVYHLGDTALFSDLQLVPRREAVDVAIVPIGGHYTMDQVDAVTAVGLVAPKIVLPCHYGTFPAIEVDMEQFKANVAAQTDAEVVVLEPGGTYSGSSADDPAALDASVV